MSNIINTTNLFLSEVVDNPDKYMILVHGDTISVYSDSLELLRKISSNSFMEFMFQKMNLAYEFV